MQFSLLSQFLKFSLIQLSKHRCLFTDGGIKRPVSGRLVIFWSSIWMPCLGKFLTAGFYVRAAELNHKTVQSVDSARLFNPPWSSSAHTLSPEFINCIDQISILSWHMFIHIQEPKSRSLNCNLIYDSSGLIQLCQYTCLHLPLGVRVPLKFCTRHVNYMEVTLYVWNSQR